MNWESLANWEVLKFVRVTDPARRVDRGGHSGALVSVRHAPLLLLGHPEPGGRR
jgi:hypothetical protein